MSLKRRGAWRLIPVMLVLAAATLAQGQDDPIRLQLRLRPGEAYRQSMITDQNITQELQGQSLQMKQRIGFETRMDVKSVAPDGVMTIDVKYTRVLMEQSGPAGEVRYDSADPPAQTQPQAAGFAALLDEGFTFTIAPSGKVTSVSGVEAMRERVSAKLALPEGPARQAAVEALRAHLSDDSLRRTLEQATAIYPDGPVGIGQSWKKTLTIPAMFPMVIDATYTLTGREAGIANVSLEATVRSNPEGEGMQSGPMRLSFEELDGRQRGAMEIDEATGWVTRSELKQRFTMALRMEPAEGQGGAATQPGAMTQPITIPMVMDATMTIEGGRIEAADSPR